MINPSGINSFSAFPALNNFGMQGGNAMMDPNLLLQLWMRQALGMTGGMAGMAGMPGGGLVPSVSNFGGGGGGDGGSSGGGFSGGGGGGNLGNFLGGGLGTGGFSGGSFGGGSVPSGAGSRSSFGGTPSVGSTRSISPSLAGNDAALARAIESQLAGSPLAGQNLGAHFVEAGRKHNVDPVALAAISKHETNFGKLGVGVSKHMGVGAFDASPNKPRQWDGAVNQIYSGAKTFDNLRAKAGVPEDAPLKDQLAGVNAAGWATDQGWANKVGNHYNNLAEKIDDIAASGQVQAADPAKSAEDAKAADPAAAEEGKESAATEGQESTSESGQSSDSSESSTSSTSDSDSRSSSSSADSDSGSGSTSSSSDSGSSGSSGSSSAGESSSGGGSSGGGSSSGGGGSDSGSGGGSSDK